MTGGRRTDATDGRTDATDGRTEAHQVQDGTVNLESTAGTLELTGPGR